jgi:hypothetical protein
MIGEPSRRKLLEQRSLGIVGGQEGVPLLERSTILEHRKPANSHG